MKRARKIVMDILIAVIALPLVLMLAVQMPAVQKWICSKVSSYLSEQVDGSVEIGGFSFRPFNTLILDDILVKGPDTDTLLSAGRIHLNANVVSAMSEKLDVNRISIENSRLCIRHISDSTTNLSAFIQSLQSGDTSDTLALPWKEIKLNRFVLDGFSVQNDSISVLDSFGLEINGARYAENSFSCNFKDYKPIGKAGGAKRRFNGALSVCDTLAVLESVKYRDGYSNIVIPTLSAEYASFSAIADSSRSTKLKLILGESKAGLGSLAPFAEKYEGNSAFITASGCVEGDLHSMRIDSIHLSSDTGKSDLHISGVITMPDDANRAEMDVKLYDSRFTVRDINRIIGQFDESACIDFLPKRSLNAEVLAECRLKSNGKDFDGNGGIAVSGYGGLEFSLTGRSAGKRNYDIEGDLSTDRLNLGYFSMDLDSCLLSADIKGSSLLGNDDVFLLDDVNISELHYNGYSYSGIRANGQFKDGHFKTSATSTDSSLTFSLYADCNYDDLYNGEISAFIDLEKADFREMNFSEKEMELSMRVRSNLKWSSEKNIIGQLDIYRLGGKVENGRFNAGNISFRSEETDSLYRAVIESDLVNASYTGRITAAEAYEDIIRLLNRKIPNLMGGRTLSNPNRETPSNAELNITTGDAREILTALYPSLYVDPGTILSLNLSEGENISLNVISGLISYGNIFAKDFSLSANNNEGPVALNALAGIFRIGQYQYSDSNITASVDSNTVDMNFKFDNGGKYGNEANASKADISASLFFADTTASDVVMIARLHPSIVEINGSNVNLSPSTIKLKRYSAIIDSFSISGTDSRFEVNGTISKNAADTINLAVDNFDLSTLNGFVLDPDDNIQGRLTGTASASGITGPNFAFFSSLKGREFCFGNTEMGEIKALCKWDAEKERVNILLSNTFRSKIPLNVSGWYDPSTKNTNINVSLDSLSLGFVPAIAPAVFSGMNGYVSGKINVSGPLDSIRISSSGTRLHNVYSLVEFTHVPYYLNGEFDVTEKGVSIDKVRLQDELGNKGTASGGVYFNNFEETTLDMRFHANNMLALNTTFQEDADGFYGRVFGTGDVWLHGPVKGLLIDIDALVESGEVHIPITDSYKRKNSLLTFVNARKTTADAYDSLMTVRNITKSVNVDRVGTITTTRLEATPATSLFVDMGGGSDMIRAAGSGTLELVSGNNNFDIRGVYTIAEGNCRMSFLGISSKEFEILEGGTVNFNGDVDKTELNVTARYSTKASIETLIGDNSSVTSRRTVHSNINVSGSVTNPTLKFKVDVPDLEPATKNRVESALSTDEKNLRQSLALLISGSFVPDENGGIVNSSTILYSNASEIVSSQVSNLFHQLNIPVDLGFKYQPSNSGVNVFDVAVSTQLFHNRVTINGSIGNQQYMTGGASTDIVGNVDVEIKLNKSGKVRLNLFSHAADKYSNYLDQTQRNGVGIVFQEEFNTWMELWNDILRRSRKRENQ